MFRIRHTAPEPLSSSDTLVLHHPPSPPIYIPYPHLWPSRGPHTGPYVFPASRSVCQCLSLCMAGGFCAVQFFLSCVCVMLLCKCIGTCVGGGQAVSLSFSRCWPSWLGSSQLSANELWNTFCIQQYSECVELYRYRYTLLQFIKLHGWKNTNG